MDPREARAARGVRVGDGSLGILGNRRASEGSRGPQGGTGHFLAPTLAQGAPWGWVAKGPLEPVWDPLAQ